MNLFPGDYVAGLVPLVGTLVTMDGQSVNLSSWETKLSVSLGGETASNGVTTRATSAASSLDVNHNHHATQRSGALFKVVKVSKVGGLSEI